MGEMISSIPTVFWVFAGISLIIFTSNYAKNMNRLSSNNDEEIKEIKERLDAIEQHLDLRN